MVKPVGPGDMSKYKSEFQRGAKLFQNALEEYNKSNIPEQKDQFKKVMDEARQVLHETAEVVCKNKKEIAREKKLEDDYDSFLQNPSKEQYDILHKDIESLQKME